MRVPLCARGAAWGELEYSLPEFGEFLFKARWGRVAAPYVMR